MTEVIRQYITQYIEKIIECHRLLIELDREWKEQYDAQIEINSIEFEAKLNCHLYNKKIINTRLQCYVQSMCEFDAVLYKYEESLENDAEF